MRSWKRGYRCLTGWKLGFQLALAGLVLGCSAAAPAEPKARVAETPAKPASPPPSPYLHVTEPASLKEGCNALEPVACYRLGLQAETPAEAARAFQRACAREHPDGCARIGVAMLNGRGIARDEGQGVWFLRRGCDRRGAAACRALADLRLNRGRGWFDADKGHAFLKRACEYGDQTACDKAESMSAGVALHMRTGADVSADGLRFRTLSCGQHARGPMALVNLVRALAPRRAEIAACGRAGTPVSVEFEWGDARRGLSEGGVFGGPAAAHRTLQGGTGPAAMRWGLRVR